MTCRLVFLNELNEGTVNAYRRNGDNTLTLVWVRMCLHINEREVCTAVRNTRGFSQITHLLLYYQEHI